LATGANSAAASATNQASQTAAGTIGTPNQFGQLGLTAAGNVTNAYNDIYGAQVKAASGDNGMGDLFQAAGMAAAAYFGS
jgi:hypothetical protein